MSGLVRISEAESGRVVHTLGDGSTEVTGMTWDPTSQVLATGAWDGVVRMYAVTEDGARRTFALRAHAATGGVIGLAFSPDGTRIAAGDLLAETFVVWDVGPYGDAEVMNVASSPAGTLGVAFGPSGLLHTVDSHGAVEVWDEESGRVEVFDRPGQPAPATFGSLVVSANRGLIGVGNSGEGIHVWDGDTGESLLTEIPREGAWRPAFSPDGQRIAVATERAVTVYGRDGDTHAETEQRSGSMLIDPMFSPDGETVAVLDMGERNTPTARTLVLWNWRSRSSREIPIGTGQSFSYSPDGRRIAVADLDGRTRVVDVESGDVVVRLGAASGNVATVAYNDGGDILATGGVDGTTTLWHADSGDEIVRLPNTGSAVDAVSFSPDGHRLATASTAGDVVRVWTLDPLELREIALAEVDRAMTDAECRRFLHRPCET